MSASNRLWKKVLVFVVVIGFVGTFVAREAVFAQGDSASTAIVDVSQLPACSSALVQKPVQTDKLPPPDFKATTACKLPTTVSVMQQSASVPSLFSRSAGTSPVGITATAYAWANHILSCRWSTCSTSAPGVTEMYFDASTQIPSLPSGYSWANYHLYNRFHFTHPSYSSSCNGSESISGGIAYGNVQGVVWTNRIIAEFLAGSCNYYDSHVTAVAPGALTFHVFRSGSAWAIDVWLGSWSRVATITTAWAVAAEVEYGQEIAAGSGDLNTIVVPVSFIHKANIAGTSNSLRPWSDYALVAPLNGRTRSLPTSSSGPLKVMDLFGGDFTSMASHNVH